MYMLSEFSLFTKIMINFKKILLMWGEWTDNNLLIILFFQQKMKIQLIDVKHHNMLTTNHSALYKDFEKEDSSWEKIFAINFFHYHKF